MEDLLLGDLGQPAQGRTQKEEEKRGQHIFLVACRVLVKTRGKRIVFHLRKVFYCYLVSFSMHDVIVVGAGPAGSFAAYACSSFGLDTLLLDKHKLPRNKACGGASGRGIESYCGKEILDIVEREGSGDELYFDYRKIGELEREKLFFKREKLDYYISRMAEDAGCKIKDGTEVVSISMGEDGARVLTKRESYHSQIVIGGDGANSVVGRSVGLVNERRRHYAAIRSEIDARETENDTLVDIQEGIRQHTYFFSDLLGFAWLIPNKDCLNVGMGVLFEKAEHLKGKFKTFLTHLGLDEESPMKGQLIPYRPLDKIYSERILLVGDAGGFVDPWTGCGIELGIESAESAAKTCKRAFDKSDFSELSMSRYQDSLRPTLRNLRFRSKAISLLDNLTPKDFVMTTLGEVFVKHLSKLA